MNDFRILQRGQRAELHLLDVETGIDQLVLEARDQLFESPTWHPDGRWLVVNADGVLYRIDALSSEPSLKPIHSSGHPELNNDHLISPEGAWHLVSANDGHIHRIPFEGGAAERITRPKAAVRAFRHFLHSVSPDGTTLAYVGTEAQGGDEWGRRALWLLNLESGEEELVGDGYSAADGPDFAPDGRSLYFNSEAKSSIEGHAQLFRHDFEEGTAEQLTFDDRVNWFPHPAPDGRRILYLSYPPGTLGHPADLPVTLRILALDTGSVRDLVQLHGGQGTINVPCWAPDSNRVAYVGYPLSTGIAT